jgi:hypothetical protein
MAKETGERSQAATPQPAAPMFAAARAVLTEIDQQADRWLEYGIAQAGEAAKLAHVARAQATAAARTMLDTVERMTSGALESAAAWSRPFVATAGFAPFGGAQA